ncbi:hypothetical protein P154DRAFT_495557 [Amniculicola lignicola CBS 123094]|uniref:MFS general substrate transporter n=1 Tax=Amniculicola lignicola CBS 123094 TaxID=1392246 RepID=A0A6A5WAS1_9PLEO|nr:hypothetical protein P154DRAFT_495557 [Amniculicola lignicola CBS 123094]
MHTEPNSRRVLEEATPLLDEQTTGPQETYATYQTSTIPRSQNDFPAWRVLPIAILAALAMATTAGTAFYAYATLLCADPEHCAGDETSQYSRFVATTTAISNVCGLFSLGYLQRLSLRHRKRGLFIWIVCRSMSAVMLLLGVRVRNIFVALSGRIFEGLASDNILHFILNTIYTRVSDQEKTCSLINQSLALYLIGISISPFVAGLFRNFAVSFVMAIALFGVCLGYLQTCVPGLRGTKEPVVGVAVMPHPRFTPSSFSKLAWTATRTIGVPLKTFQDRPAYTFIGLSVLVYNIVQSYVFSALLVYTSTQLGFTGRENGMLVSIAHSTASLYIFSTLFLIPRIGKTVQRASTTDWLPAVFSLMFQVTALTGFGMSSKGWQIYLSTILLALSLPTPSFIKGYATSLFSNTEKSTALAALTTMETLGSILGPIILGSAQTLSKGPSVFFIAAFISLFSLLSFLTGTFLLHKPPPYSP